MFLFAVKVQGMSMWPTLVPGRRYVASSLLKPRVGDCIVFQNPKNEAQIFVKKIIKKEHDGYVVSGEREGSTGSKEIGIVNKEFVIGKLFIKQ